MTKRILSLVLVCILAIPILAVPASASQVTGTQFDMFATGLGNLLNDIEENILDAISVGNGWIAEVYEQVISVGNTINSWCNQIYRGLANHWTNLEEWFTEQTAALLAPLNSMKASIEELVEGLIYGSDVGKSTVGAIEGQVSEQTGQFNDSQEVIQEATRPDVEDVDVDLTGKFTVDARYNNVLSYMFVNPTSPSTPIFYVYFFALTLSLVSYGIFGKR